MGIDIFSVQPHVVSRDLRGYSFLIYGGVKFGKALYDEAVLPTPNGDKKVKDVEVGDYLFDRYGNPTKVTGVFPQGTIPAYKVIFEDGREVICNDEHIWFAKTSNQNTYKQITTKELKSGMRIPMNQEVSYSTKDFPIDPYVIGCFLGDGCCKERQLTISSDDEELVAEISKLIGAKEYYRQSDKNYSWHFRYKEDEQPTNNSGRKIESYQTQAFFGSYAQYICVDAFNKRIPPQYLEGDVEQRYALLQGLLDTDGNIHKKDGSISFTSTSLGLINDFSTLVRSLGYRTGKITQDKRTYKYKNGGCYVIKINCANQDKYKMFRLERRKEIALKWVEVIKNRDYSYLRVKDVVPLEKDLPMTCFLVDNDEHLFLANDFIVTHNTSFIAKCKKHLLLATEPGYKALPGVMALPITKWSEMKQVVKQLRKPEAHDMYEVIGIDTADLAYQYCSQYVCANEGVDTIADIPFGKGYNLVAPEFDNLLREIVNLGYGLILTSHEQDKVFKDEAGIEFNKIVPTLDKRGKLICERLVDVLGYGRIIPNKEGQEERKLFLRGTTRFEAGARFKYIVPCIDMGYKNLANAISDAIEEEAKHVDDDTLFTDEKEKFIPKEEINFDEQKEIFNSMVERLIENIEEEAFATEYAPKISDIVEKHLGRGKKVSQATRSQVEALVLINGDLHDLLTDIEEDNG